ncbi:MerR family transcriptional regulator [Streptosporangium sp. NBC_01756]|uniref:MerR family transcriptional regulator n=1 Tax=Streptosporangium sp. NBC_01756 TaxID=2975950 RepID=UPI002DDADBFC|nr:MerR family transcriptional regulator [Streptosporangium sp. NBC_01756]WSC87178.1 MerR family transcriptional regulator [Streptosporangium sp. NBC_01756]
MIGRDDTGHRWSIGEVARASGMTVRALRHYDEIGLLSAGERTASGHRRYTGRDVRRLYRVRALRTLGLSLEEIATVLADSTGDLVAMHDLLTAQLRGLEAHAARIQRLTHRLRGLLEQIDGASMPDPDQFMTTLEMISVFETSFTTEQREQLARQRAELGPEAVEAAKSEWAGLVEELLCHVQDDTPVDDPRVRALVARWDALGNRFHAGGDAGEQTKAAAQRAWRENSAEIGRSLPWPADRLRDLVHYLERVRQTG